MRQIDPVDDLRESHRPKRKYVALRMGGKIENVWQRTLGVGRPNEAPFECILH